LRTRFAGGKREDDGRCHFDTRARAAARSKAERRTTNARMATLLLVPIAILTVIGLGATMSASAIIGKEQYDDQLFYFTSQLKWVGLGIVVLVLATRVRYQRYRRFAIPIFLLSVVGLMRSCNSASCGAAAVAGSSSDPSPVSNRPSSPSSA